jgi:hypothetical protein
MASKEKRPASPAKVAGANSSSSSSEKKQKTDASVDAKEQARLQYEAELPTRSRAAAAAELPPRPDDTELLPKIVEWRSLVVRRPGQHVAVDEEPEREPAGVFYVDNVIPKALTQSMDSQFQLIAAHPNPDYHPGMCGLNFFSFWVTTEYR